MPQTWDLDNDKAMGPVHPGCESFSSHTVLVHSLMNLFNLERD